MKFSLLILFIIGLHFNLFAQYAEDLQPIGIKKGVFSTKYFYEDQNFDSPYGLQIPLMKANDPQVTKDFNAFKNSMKTAKIVNLIASGFSLYAFFNRDKMPGSTYWGALGTAGAVSAFFNIRSSILLDRSVKRYNNIVSGTELGFQFDRTYSRNGIVSLGMSHRF
jgi:hypothetical protein